MSATTLVTPRGDFAPGDINFHTAEAVRWLIHREDRVQNHVAISCGMGPEELSRFMTGDEPFSVVAVMLLAETLGTSPAKLLELAAAFRDGDEPEAVIEP